MGFTIEIPVFRDNPLMMINEKDWGPPTGLNFDITGPGRASIT